MRQLIRFATSLLFAPAVAAAVHPAWGQDSVQAGTRSINGMQMYYEIRGSAPPSFCSMASPGVVALGPLT
jgi:hypothetical protein